MTTLFFAFSSVNGCVDGRWRAVWSGADSGQLRWYKSTRHGDGVRDRSGDPQQCESETKVTVGHAPRRGYPRR